MLYDKLITPYSEFTNDFIMLSIGKMSKQLGKFGEYKNLHDLFYARILYYLAHDVSIYTEEQKAFLYSELENVSIKPHIYKPPK